MDADEDPGGLAHPTVFYGLWPRVTEQEDAGESADAEPALSAAEQVFTQATEATAAIYSSAASVASG